MSAWEEFEVQCVDDLSRRFGQYACFTHQGGADSTVPDILVETSSKPSFYMEAKHTPAQCGQFVLLPDLDTRTFQYSAKNANSINKYSELIIDYMNQDFDAFREAGTAGKEIRMENGESIFASWIVQAYRDKGTKFFITNGYTILPIQEFSKYFDVSAKYRIKRSGSGSVGRTRLDTVTSFVEGHDDYAVTGCQVSRDKLFVLSENDLHGSRFLLHGFEYMFSLRGDKYEVRRLSNTYNANVIFSILQKSSDGLSDEEFIQFLK